MAAKRPASTNGRYYRYPPGQKFALHRDGFLPRDNGEQSKLTCILYLNDDFTGGETAVKNVMIEPRQGMALIFRHEFPHEGRPVLTGTKYVLRTDVMYRDRARDFSVPESGSPVPR